MGCALSREDGPRAVVVPRRATYVAHEAVGSGWANTFRWYQKQFESSLLEEHQVQVRLAKKMKQAVDLVVTETPEETVFATVGLSKGVLPGKTPASKFGELGDELYGHELVLRLRKRRGAAPHRPPDWPMKVLGNVLALQGTRGARRFALLKAPEVLEGADQDVYGAVGSFVLAPADSQDDLMWAGGLSGVSFLFVVGLTRDETEWCEAHSVPAFLRKMRSVQARTFYGSTSLTRPSVVAKHPETFAAGM